ncbi:hypothetical protein UlMin_033503 [Ulmus minor]
MILLVLATSLLMGCTNLALGWEELLVKIATGKVLCQDCSKDWNDWVHGNKPIKGSIVSIIYMDERSIVVHYASDTTNKIGQFELKRCRKKIQAKVLLGQASVLGPFYYTTPMCDKPDTSDGQSNYHDNNGNYKNYDHNGNNY